MERKHITNITNVSQVDLSVRMCDRCTILNEIVLECVVGRVGSKPVRRVG
jgi:hypothetical protein